MNACHDGLDRRRFLAAAAVAATGLPPGAAAQDKPQKPAADELAPLLKRFVYSAKEEHVTVFTDISRDFARQHARHGEKVWKHFGQAFDKTPGSRALMYYTRNDSLSERIGKIVPRTVVSCGRSVTARYDKDHWKWFLMPYQIPDFAAQIHQLSHSFLHANYAGCEDYPWLKEGSGLYWENGTWTKEGVLFVLAPLPSVLKQFRELGGKKMALEDLVTLPRKEFYEAPVNVTHPQCLMFIWYMEKVHPALMSLLYAQLCRQEITDNDQILDFIQKTTRLKWDDLDRRYVEFELRYR